MENMKRNGHNLLCFDRKIEQLIRDSERLEIAKDLVANNKYPDKDALNAILGIKKAGANNETI